jgi:hypothetical protein
MNTQQRGAGGCKHLGEEGEGKGTYLWELSINKDWKGRRAKSGWVIRCCRK